jgi:diacylglycerol kinase
MRTKISLSTLLILRNCLEILNSGVNVAIFAINKRYHESTKSVKSVTRVT